MMLNKVSISQFRNIEYEEIILSPKLNIFYGMNASGKTSIFEAIHYLGSARSFRTSNTQELIKHGYEHFIISGILNNSPIGIKKSKDKTLIKVKGSVVKRTSELARSLPIQVIHPESHVLLSGGPSFRRKYLDWGVFHVEHGFYDIWIRYQKALKQRNAALKQRDLSMYTVWDEEMSRTALFIDEARKQYINQLTPLILDCAQMILGLDNISVSLESGWDVEENLSSILKQNINKDIQRGYTLYGPHKADLKIKVNNYKAQAEISRGQQKMLVYALRLAQIKLFHHLTNQSPVVLIDDFTAELDERHRSLLLNQLGEMNAQICLNCVDMKGLENLQNESIFYVERGHVKQML